jgi:dihydrofolate reductase
MIKPEQPIISAIVAMGENRVIGKNNQLPWRLPADLKRFKSLTTGHPILMGRKTYESIGKPLPNRTNIIISRNAGFEAPGCIVVSTFDDALLAAGRGESKEIFIIGGAEIYKQLLPRTERLYLTIVHHSFEGDAYFTEFDKSDWREVKREDCEADAENPYAYSFLVLERVVAI